MNDRKLSIPIDKSSLIIKIVTIQHLFDIQGVCQKNKFDFHKFY